ncbi:MAG: stage III sporulation protein AF [Clostridia bacterium]|nr:stage III sporulation protein AF [Clostridia bacterium]
MISWISSWAQGIIISVIIASIIEMILPEGSSKKYIKVVIGVFILFTIVVPVINKFKGNSVNIASMIDFDKYNDSKEVVSNNLEKSNNFNIKQMYETNLKVDIKSKIKSKGFEVQDVDLKISDDGEYKLKCIDITISGEIINEEDEKKQSNSNVIGIVDSIEKISVEISNKTTKQEKEYQISNKNANNLKEYLSNIYDIKEKNILIH